MNQHSSNQMDLEQPTADCQPELDGDADRHEFDEADADRSEFDEADADRPLSDRERKCIWYTRLLHAHPLAVLAFNLKGRKYDLKALNKILASIQFIERLRLMLLELGLLLVNQPTIDQVKPWIYIPIQVLSCPIDGKDFGNIDTKIRDTLKDLLESGIKSSDRIQLKNIFPWTTHNYAEHYICSYLIDTGYYPTCGLNVDGQFF